MLQGFLGQRVNAPTHSAPVTASTTTAAVVLAAVLVLAGGVVIARRGRSWNVDGAKDARPFPRRKIHRPPTTLPFLENTLDVARHAPQIHSWIASLVLAADGEPVLIRMLGRPPMLVLATPGAFEDCLKTQFPRFPKGPEQRGNINDLFGHGIFAVDGPAWVHQRKTASHLFTARALRETMTEVVRDHSRTLCRILAEASKADSTGDQRGMTIDLHRLLNRVTFEVFAEIGLGISLRSLERETEHPFQRAFDQALHLLAKRFQRPGWFWRLQRWLGIGLEGELLAARRVIDDTVYGLIATALEERQERKRRRDQSTTTNPTASTTPDVSRGRLVTLFLDHQDADAGAAPFDPTFLRDVVVNFLVAGRDTSAQGMSWLFVCLSRHPEVVDKIRKEIATQLPECIGPDGLFDPPTLEQVQRLEYLEAAIKETLRLYPPVPVIPKSAAEDTLLSDGTFIRKGTEIVLSTYSMGRLPRVWGPNAQEFCPDRWLDPASGKPLNYPATQFATFNAGPRMCLGMKIALLEMKIVVATVIANFNLEILNEDVTYELSLTLPIQGELRTGVTRR